MFCPWSPSSGATDRNPAPRLPIAVLARLRIEHSLPLKISTRRRGSWLRTKRRGSNAGGRPKLPAKAEDYFTAKRGIVLRNYVGSTLKCGMRAQMGPTDGEESNNRGYCDKSYDIQTLPLTGKSASKRSPCVAITIKQLPNSQCIRTSCRRAVVEWPARWTKGEAEA
jgi:hypothetical protein